MKKADFKCNFRDCSNKPYVEVYWTRKDKPGKLKGWCYLCRKHFDSEKKSKKRLFNAWAEAEKC